MSDGLVREWRERAAAAAEWDAGHDPEPVLEALALTVALELTGDLGRVPGAERDRLRRLGQRALLHVGGVDLDEEDLEALRMCAAIARDGLRALSGRPPEAPADLDTRLLVPPSEMARLLRGELDGFAAGSLALKIRRSRAARAELGVLRALEDPEALGPSAERPLRLAAAEAAAVLDPSGGRVVGCLGDVEAVLFDGSPRRLALYAEDPAPLRLVAEALTTDGMREGYWVGRVRDGVRRVEATLHVGDRHEPWTIELP